MPSLLIPTRLLGSGWLVVVIAAICLTAPSAVDNALGQEQAPADVAAAIKQLDGPKFSQRQAAHQVLLKAGAKAIDSLEGATKSNQAEVATRALEILIELARGKEATEAALSAIDRISKNAARPIASQATAALADLRMTDGDRALAALNAAGARIIVGRDGKPFSVTVSSDAELALVKDLGKLRYLRIKGQGVTDLGVLHLASVKGLSSLTIFESSLTKVGIGRLKELKSLNRLSLSLGRNPLFRMEDLRQLRHATQLNSLSLHSADGDLGFLADLKQLTTISISDAHLGDKNVATLNKLNLRRCMLSLTKVDDEQLRKVSAVEIPLSLTVITSPGVTANGWRHLRGVPLVGLSLGMTSIADADLSHIGAIPTLESVMIFKSDVTDAGLEHLHALKALKSLSLQETKVTDEGVAEFKKALPNVMVSLGAPGVFPALPAPKRINIHTNPETGRRTAHLVGRLTAADVDTLEKEPNLDGLYFPAATRDEDLRLLGPIKVKDLVVNSKRVTDAGIKFLEDHPTLERLHLWSSSITDAAVDSIARMQNLTKLYLSESTISDEAVRRLIRQLADRGKIDSLSFVKCPKITGAGLQEIGKLESLEHLTLAGLSGLPSELLNKVGLLKNLHGLAIDGVVLNEADLTHLAGLTKLETLRLNNPIKSQLTDEGLVHLSRLTSLKLLTISGSQITDHGVRHLAKLNRLEQLDVSHSSVSDQGLAALSDKLPNLTRLALVGTNVTDGGMESVAKLRRLESLRLEETQVGDRGLARLVGLAKLKYVMIDAESVSVEGRKAFQQHHPAGRLTLR